MPSFLGSRSPFCELAAEAFQLRDPRLQSLLARGGLLLGEGLFAPCLVLPPAPSEQDTLGQVVLAADLRRAFVAGGDLTDAFQLELPGVLSPP
jgi:hypothetical protein